MGLPAVGRGHANLESGRGSLHLLVIGGQCIPAGAAGAAWYSSGGASRGQARRGIGCLVLDARGGLGEVM